MEKSDEKRLKYYELLSEFKFLSELDPDEVDIFIKNVNIPVFLKILNQVQ